MADAELVLEDYLRPKDRRFETAEAEKIVKQGKAWFHFEWPGYMGKAYKASTFHVTGITMRKSACLVVPKNGCEITTRAVANHCRATLP